MGREETSKVKKQVMEGLVKVLPNARILNRKTIISGDKTIKIWASKDYKGTTSVGNWYGFFSEEIEDLDKPERTLLLFTTGDAQNFLAIPFMDFEKYIKPILRIIKDGYFFLFRRDNQGWFLPTDYIPKNRRVGVSERGIPLDKYVNDLSFVGGSYEEYLKLSESKKIDFSLEKLDITFMIKLIAEKDPTFLAKSTEEKLIIIRYHQIKNQ